MNSHIWSWNLLELVLNMTIVIRGWSYSSISVLYILGYALWFFNNILNLAAAMPQYSLDFDSHNDWFGQNWDRNQSEELWVLLIFCGYHESSGFWTLFQLLPTEAWRWLWRQQSHGIVVVAEYHGNAPLISLVFCYTPLYFFYAI